jgi:hypothetical protein
MGRPSFDQEKGFVSGKIGFQRENGSTELWDDQVDVP